VPRAGFHASRPPDEGVDRSYLVRRRSSARQLGADGDYLHTARRAWGHRAAGRRPRCSRTRVASRYLAQCNLGNFGTRDIPVTGFDIVDESGNAFSVNRGCGSAIPAGFICQIFAPGIPSGQAVACTATVSNGSTVLGTLLLFDNTGTGVPVRAQALR
jgi:hypothetical protein